MHSLVLRKKIQNYKLKLLLTQLVFEHINSDSFVVRASALKTRTKVLTTNLFTHHNKCGGLLEDSSAISSEMAGFSLLEVLVVIIMVGILSAIAAPSWFSFTNRQRVNKANDIVVSAVQEAQRQAKKQKLGYSVSFITNNNIPEFAIYPKGSDPTTYWRVLGGDLGIQPGQIVLGTNLTGTNTTTSTSSVSYASTTSQTITFDYTGALDFVVKTNTNSLTSFQTNNIGNNGLIIAVAVPTPGSPTQPTAVKRCVIVKTLLGSLKTGKDTECN